MYTLDQFLELVKLAVSFTGNVNSLTDKSTATVNDDLTSLTTLVKDLLSNQSKDVAKLEIAVTAFRETVVQLKKEIQDDLTVKIEKGKEIAGLSDADLKSTKRGNAKTVIKNLTTTLTGSIVITDRFLSLLTVLDSVTKTIAAGDWNAGQSLFEDIETFVEEAQLSIKKVVEVNGSSAKYAGQTFSDSMFDDDDFYIDEDYQ